jgi:V-type H+-transporting ATPase subunit H
MSQQPQTSSSSSSSSTVVQQQQQQQPKELFRQYPEDLDVTRNNEAVNEFQMKTLELRSQRPQWTTYFTGKMIEKEDYDLINKFDSNSPVERERILTNANERIELIKTLMTIINKVSKESTLEYTVTLIDDLLHENKSRVELFHAYAKKYKENIYQTFTRLLERQDLYLINQVSRIIVKLACWSSDLIPDKELRVYILWAKEQLEEKVNKINISPSSLY